VPGKLRGNTKGKRGSISSNTRKGYLERMKPMSRTVIDLDEDALAVAAEELGTTTKVETVNRALREVAARRRSHQFLDLIGEMELDLDEQTMGEAWR
jgi:Arc/MetJ family transcription regulator